MSTFQIKHWLGEEEVVVFVWSFIRGFEVGGLCVCFFMDLGFVLEGGFFWLVGWVFFREYTVFVPNTKKAQRKAFTINLS